MPKFKIETKYSKYALDLTECNDYFEEINLQEGDITIYYVTLYNLTEKMPDDVNIKVFYDVSRNLIDFINNNPTSIYIYVCDSEELPRKRGTNNKRNKKRPEADSNPQKIRNDLFSALFNWHSKPTDDLTDVTVVGCIYDENNNQKKLYTHLIFKNQMQKEANEIMSEVGKLIIKP